MVLRIIFLRRHTSVGQFICRHRFSSCSSINTLLLWHASRLSPLFVGTIVNDGVRAGSFLCWTSSIAINSKTCENRTRGSFLQIPESEFWAYKLIGHIAHHVAGHTCRPVFVFLKSRKLNKTEKVCRVACGPRGSVPILASVPLHGTLKGGRVHTLRSTTLWLRPRRHFLSL